MAFGIIYKITNIINGKIYIGQTTATLESRFYSHCQFNRNKDNSVIFKAIKKYGKENFKIEKIDCAYSEDELNKKEINYFTKKKGSSFIF